MMQDAGANQQRPPSVRRGGDLVEENLRLAIRANGVGCWVWDSGGERAWFDDACWDLVGLRRTRDENAIPFLMVAKPGEKESNAARFNELTSWVSGSLAASEGKEVDRRNTPTRLEREFRIEHEVKGDRNILVRLSHGDSVSEGKGHLCYGVMLDISGRRWAVEEREKYLQDIIAFASHDLRSPVYKISQSASLLGRALEGKLKQEDEENLEQIERAANRLIVFIDGLLNLAKARKDALKLDDINLRRLIGHVLDDLFPVTTVQPPLRREEVVSSIPELPKIVGDSIRLRSLFQNILSNAIKYRDRERPLRIAIEGEVLQAWGDSYGEERPSGPGPWVQVRIRDTGIGFSRKHAKTIFDGFKRIRNKDRDDEGSGIGLAVCKFVAEAHGGTIWAHSKRGEGSTFVVTLPIDPRGSV